MMATDSRAAHQAPAAASTDEQQAAAVAMRIGSLTTRQRELELVALTNFAAQVTKALQDMAPAARAVCEALGQLSQLCPKPPRADDPMVRALAARRHTSTGPAQQHRPPRRGDPRRTR